MSPVVRLLVTAAVRLGLLFYAGWFAFHDAPLGSTDLPMVSRIGLVFLCLILQVILGELDGLRTHFGLLVGGLRAAGRASGTPELGQAADEAAASAGLSEASKADPKASVDILVQALATKDPDTVEKVHKHLVRLTGKNLPPEIALWQRWWQENRDSWAGPPAGAQGNDG